MADNSKYNGSTRTDGFIGIQKTASEIIQSGQTIYADGSPISTYSIKGNTVQNGTPTPSNPVTVVGVGELETTGEHTGEYKTPILTTQGSAYVYLNEPLYKIGDYADTINSDGTITRQIKKINLGDKNYTITPSGNYTATLGDGVIVSNNIIAPALCTDFQVVAAQNYASTAYSLCTAINLNSAISINKTGYEGMTAVEFKAAMNGKYLYYALATPTTEQITLPSIPTTDGANTITVDTTVQPSEFSATWTGWHDSSVQEYDGTDWQ